MLLISTFANMSVCLLKDAAFARMFSGSAGKDDDAKKKAGLSRKVLLLWFGRDVITQFFVFTLPFVLALCWCRRDLHKLRGLTRADALVATLRMLGDCGTALAKACRSGSPSRSRRAATAGPCSRCTTALSE